MNREIFDGVGKMTKTELAKVLFALKFTFGEKAALKLFKKLLQNVKCIV